MDKVKIQVSFDKIVDGEDFHDSELEQNIQSAIGSITINTYLRNIVERTLRAVDGVGEPINYLGIRVVATDHPRVGYCFKTAKLLGGFPGIVAGFGGDIVEFQKSVIHEILHYVEWDEYMIERKAEEICAKEETIPWQ